MKVPARRLRSPRVMNTSTAARRSPQRSALNDRERRIFEARRLAEDPITLADLASEFGVSPERVRQIDVGSFEKVQKAVKNRVATIKTRALTGN